MITTLILITALTSCTTYQKSEPFYPDIDFPTVPDPIAEDGTAVVTMQNGVVSMPFWYWQDITIYFIKSQSAEDQYKFLQKVYLQR